MTSYAKCLRRLRRLRFCVCAVILSAVSLRLAAQNAVAVTPDCVINFRITAVNGAGPSAGSFDNRQVGCNFWQASWAVSGSLFVFTLEVQASKDNVNFFLMPGAVAFGSNPQSGNGVSNLINASGNNFAPFVRIVLTGGSGTGEVRGVLLGFRTAGQAGLAATGTTPITNAQNPAATTTWSSSTPPNFFTSASVTGFASVAVMITGSGTVTGGAVVFLETLGTAQLPVTCYGTGSATGTASQLLATQSIAFTAAPSLNFTCPVEGSTTFTVRLQSAITGTGTVTVQLAASAATASPNPIQGVLQAQVTSGIGPGFAQKLTSDSTTPFNNAGADVTTPVTVKSDTANLYGWDVTNTNATVCYLLVFNTATPVLGTTVPLLSPGIPANESRNLSLTIPIGFSSALSVAASRSPTGAGGLTCNMGVNLWFL